MQSRLYSLKMFVVDAKKGGDTNSNPDRHWVMNDMRFSRLEYILMTMFEMQARHILDKAYIK